MIKLGVALAVRVRAVCKLGGATKRHRHKINPARQSGGWKCPKTASLEKRDHTPPCSSEELFFGERNGGHREEILVGDVVSLVFYRVFVSTTGLEFF